jgi:NAD(P)H-quinone oxidoreductase subunit 5
MSSFVWGAFVMSAPLLLLLSGMVPSGVANRHVRAMTRVGVLSTLFAFGAAIVNAALLMTRPSLDVSLLSLPGPVNIGVYFDSLAAVMLLLVSFIGVVIARFSIRYLSGEASQGRFFRWINFTLGAVLLMVIANNLVLLTFAWMLTSFGLHQLLTHYGDRPQAVMAARKKFLISRIGDLMLICALILTYRLFGSFDYATLFAATQEATGQNAAMLTATALLFVIGAMTKSAQFPFHSWLPDTMETPTPVSALMHAGVINAGGFLIIRLSPLIATSPVALNLLASVGLLTALLGALVMLTQTSIKRGLAYSTISQMGFMMLQCGLGAFSAALLHIVAHSLYKAYAFLSSGTPMAKETMIKPSLVKLSRQKRVLMFLAAASLAALVCFSASILTRSSSTNNTGGLVLSIIFTIAMTQLLWKSFATLSLRVAAEGVIKAVALTTVYFVVFRVVDSIVAPVVPNAELHGEDYDKILMLAVLTGFGFLFIIQEQVGFFKSTKAMHALYVHIANGFYLDMLGNKITFSVWHWMTKVREFARGSIQRT